MGCDYCHVFFLKKKNLIQAHIRTRRDMFLEHERLIKMVFPHFKHKLLESINLVHIHCNGLKLLHKTYVLMNQWLANPTTCNYAYN